MAILDRFRNLVGGKTSGADAQSPPHSAEDRSPNAFNTGHPIDNKEAEMGSSDAITHAKSQEDTTPTEDAQLGVKKIEAVTLAWSKTALAGVLILYVFSKCSCCFSCFVPYLD